MRELPASQAYRMMEPGPIGMVSTSDNGKLNVMSMGFHMMIQHAPPLIGCVIGPWDHSYQPLRKTGECVYSGARRRSRRNRCRRRTLLWGGDR